MTLVSNGLTAAWRPSAVTTNGRLRSRWEGEVRADLGKTKI